MQEIIGEINSWYENLTTFEFSKFDRKKTAIISVDMIKGFCDCGVLASRNHKNISQKIANFLNQAYENDFRNFILIQDLHTDESLEFATFPKHACTGSGEEATIDEISNLSFYKDMKIFYKNSLSIAYNEKFSKFLQENKELENFIVVGVCTDLCIYSAISHLCLSANEKNIKRSVFVPANLVATFDLSNHKSEFYHKFFLHHANFAFGAKICKDIV